MSPSSLLGAADAGDQSAILALNHLQGRIPSAWTITAPTVARCAVEFWQWADAHIVRSPIELPVPADSLPLDEPLDRRVTIGLAKIGIAPKQAWAEAFWKSCPEFRSAAIGEWLHRHQLAPWPERKPPLHRPACLCEPLRGQCRRSVSCD
jgi:hypothetical protein